MYSKSLVFKMQCLEVGAADYSTPFAYLLSPSMQVEVALRYATCNFRAMFFGEYSFALASPFAAHVSLNLRSATNFRMAFVMAWTSLASNVSAASPANSRVVRMSDAATGHQHAIASRTGMPPPSYKEGKMNAVAAE